MNLDAASILALRRLRRDILRHSEMFWEALRQFETFQDVLGFSRSTLAA